MRRTSERRLTLEQRVERLKARIKYADEYNAYRDRMRIEQDDKNRVYRGLQPLSPEKRSRLKELRGLISASIEDVVGDDLSARFSAYTTGWRNRTLPAHILALMDEEAEIKYEGKPPTGR